jgi:uncharacterized protein with ACT and thioredoxin-like domain
MRRVVLLVAIMAGGVLGGRFAENMFGPRNSHEISFIATGVEKGTVLVALGIFMLPIH